MSAQGKLTDNNHLSGSIFPAWFGVHPYMSPLKAYNVIKDAREGKESGFKGNIRTMIGSELEDTIIERIVPQVVPVTNVRTGYTTAFKHPTLPFSVSIDGTCYAEQLTIQESEAVKTGGEEIYLNGLGVIECKTTDTYVADGCPEHYKIQLFSQMECVPDAMWGMVAILKGSMIWIYLFRKEADFADKLAQSVQEFESRLKDNTPPNPLTSEEADTAFPGEQGQSVNLDDSIEDKLTELEAKKAWRDTLNKQIPELETEVKNMMGNAEIGFTSNFRVDWQIRNYKAQPEKLVPAKPARQIRINTLKIRRLEDE